jgi:hypothetical protein
MAGLALAKSLYAISTWTRTVALIREHPGLIAALGAELCSSVYACYRFTAKLREHEHLLDACIAASSVASRRRFLTSTPTWPRRLRHARVCERTAIR